MMAPEPELTRKLIMMAKLQLVTGRSEWHRFRLPASLCSVVALPGFNPSLIWSLRKTRRGFVLKRSDSNKSPIHLKAPVSASTPTCPSHPRRPVPAHHPPHLPDQLQIPAPQNSSPSAAAPLRRPAAPRSTPSLAEHLPAAARCTHPRSPAAKTSPGYRLARKTWQTNMRGAAIQIE